MKPALSPSGRIRSLSSSIAVSGRHVVNLRGWPGLSEWEPPRSARAYSDRLGDRNALVLYATDTTSGPFGAALLVAGPSVVDGALLVPDDVGADDPSALEALERWAAANPLRTTLGAKAWEVLTLGQFFDPKARAGCGHLAFTPNAYCGGCFIVGADLGRFFGLVVEHAAPARGKHWRGGWSVYLPGWGTQRDDGSFYRRSPNRPEIRMKARRVGWQLGWGPCGKDAEGHQYGKVRPGSFVDVLSLAYGLDADRGASFGEHRRNFGLAAVELPLVVPFDDKGAAQVASAVLSIYETALALDEKAGDWFTIPVDRAHGRGLLDLARTSSPGVIAGEILSRFQVTAPLAKFDLTETEHLASAESYHGGWCSAFSPLLGSPFEALSCDITSAFPMVAGLIGWWRLLLAEKLELEDVSEELRQLCRRAACDATVVLDPLVWRRFGCTIVETRPDGERFPIEIEDQHRPDGRMGVVPVFSPDRVMHFTWPDVVGAALSGEVPKILRATRLVPVGRQSGLRRRLAVLPGLVLDIDVDPVVALVRHRQAMKPSDPTLAGLLRVVVNALCSGILARFDDTGEGEWVGAIGERPGPWCFLPIASSVEAGSRLLLAVLDRLVRDRGGVVAYRDTDSSIVPATRDGGTLTLSDGSTVRQLSWAGLHEVLALFDALSVFGDDVPVWKCQP